MACGTSKGSLRISLTAQTYVRLEGDRTLPAVPDYLLLRFAPHLAESTSFGDDERAPWLAERRPSRVAGFLLEAAVKLPARDFHPEAQTIEERLQGLNDRERRFEDYVAELEIWRPISEKPDEANAPPSSLYSELSKFVHATESRSSVQR